MNKKERNKLILDNLPLVHKVASHLKIFMEYEDMYQEGIIGLIKAIDMYNPKRCREFSSYAYACIKGTILRGYHNNGTFIRIPVGMHEQYSRLSKVKGFSEMKSDGKYDIEYLSKATGLSNERIEMLIELFGRYKIDIQPWEEVIPYNKDLDQQIDCMNTVNYIKRIVNNYTDLQKDSFTQVFINGKGMDELNCDNHIYLIRKKLRKIFNGVPECIR